MRDYEPIPNEMAWPVDGGACNDTWCLFHGCDHGQLAIRRALYRPGATLASAPQTHLAEHSEGENALLDATVEVRGAVYGLALDVVEGQELEHGRGDVSETGARRVAGTV